MAAYLERSRLGVALPWDPIRTLSLPPRLAVVGVGGATLGGSGRTPLAIAIARALAARGRRVALVGHGHGARVQRARVVGVGDPIESCGDEALLAARALAGIADVIVAPDRDSALSLAAQRADVAVVDRLLQTRPRRVSRSLLAVDVDAPWGSGAVVPFGDLAAPRSALLDAADEVVEVGGSAARVRTHVDVDLRGVRVGLITSMARPRRALASLVSTGAEVCLHVERADHASPARGERERLARLARDHRLALWIVDEKTGVLLDVPGDVRVLRHELVLDEALVDRVASSC